MRDSVIAMYTSTKKADKTPPGGEGDGTAKDEKKEKDEEKKPGLFKRIFGFKPEEEKDKEKKKQEKNEEKRQQ